MLRQEFDDWAILFDPDTGHGFGLSPTGVYLWELLDGEHTVDALVGKLHEHAKNVPEEASDHIGAFVDELVAEGLAGFDSTLAGLPDTADRPERVSPLPPREVSEAKPFTYEPPQLIDFSGGRAAYGADCPSGSGATNMCTPSGSLAHGNCSTGTSDTGYCGTGNSPKGGYGGCTSGNVAGGMCVTGTTAGGTCAGGSGGH